MIMRTAFVGYCCAAASAGSKANSKRSFLMVPP
jgi:hypothetical protein